MTVIFSVIVQIMVVNESRPAMWRESSVRKPNLKVPLQEDFIDQ